MSWVESEAALLRERHNVVLEELVRHAHDEAMPHSAYLTEIVARSSPEILAELREDRSLVEVVLLKRHTQRVYLGALQGLRNTARILASKRRGR
jgi:hypothetical protein